MSKRQRFFVELREDEVTVISWKKLVADAEIILDTRAAPPKSSAAALRIPALNANIPENLNAAENSRKSRRKLNLDVPSSNTIVTVPTETAERNRRGAPLEDRNINSSCERKLGEKGRKEKANVKMIKAVKDELDEIAKQVAPSTVKGKMHRSMPIPCDSVRASKTSCRTKKKTKACFCCSKKTGRT